jgi:hypothetical protein
MNTDELSGIERELVLQYLVDGNVPVILTPNEDNKQKSDIHPVLSDIFPIALKAEHIKVSKNGVILLENPPQSVEKYKNQDVRVEFYFNRVGLYFISKVIQKNDELAINIPEIIHRIKDFVEIQNYNFSIDIYFEVKNKKDINVFALPWKDNEIFNRPVWKSIPLANQKRAKEYLEKFVNEAKNEHNAGNGIQLVPICNYLTFLDIRINSIQHTKKPYSVLYLDHERIVFGYDSDDYQLLKDSEYALKLSFSLKQGPIISRDLFVTCIISKLYVNDDNTKTCADCTFTTIQEEDLRYLYEKTTKKILI